MAFYKFGNNTIEELHFLKFSVKNLNILITLKRYLIHTSKIFQAAYEKAHPSFILRLLT
ncbi:hypothetical protein SAMN05518672_103136 [Chitinophaga sp. CF118]|nr:hypothetical protein SAMN05518672_103136 [Chitinophaga sp. CF118]